MDTMVTDDGLAGTFDTAIIGGGIMGCSVALRLADAGMRVAVIDRGGIGGAASGVNAGTLSLQIKRLSLMPYAIRAAEHWARMSDRLGADVKFRQSGGLNLAFTAAEEERLIADMTARREAGLPITFLGGEAARVREPALSAHVRLASFCPMDGYSNPSLTSRAFRKALTARGVLAIEHEPVQTIAAGDGGYTLRLARSGTLHARRLVLAAGAWTRSFALQLGTDLPIDARVNQMMVTERAPPLMNGVIGHISGLMSLKQSDHGTIIIGGGWQGEGAAGEPGRPVTENLANNLRFATFAMPALADLRIVRAWYGYDAFVPDFLPIVGALPWLKEAYVIACVRGGYTIGPCMGDLLAARILGEEPALPLFDPLRVATRLNMTAAA